METVWIHEIKDLNYFLKDVMIMLLQLYILNSLYLLYIYMLKYTCNDMIPGICFTCYCG